ncbi:MAG: UDP-N-acetylmuramoyl-L-alanine--D-glutamate ligase [Deltaproteobacteria bacterium]|nr:MAG: UDP-N-acetylmuramoyl-L-alanine--D-glutamate ligase [Deltaproteobacteria bacterium]
MELNQKKVLVVGLGRTGVAAASFLKKRGALVTVTDSAAEQDLAEYSQQAHQLGIKTELGHHRAETFNSSDLIVLSPGVPHTIRPITKANENGIRIMGEIEIASRFIREPIIAVTGTNGKTTTTSLLGEMLKKSGLKVFVGGNIGKPLIDYPDEKEKAQIIVAEVSSFQLDTIDTFRPKIAILLNIAEDHLDRYPDYRAYYRSKFRIFENQDANDTAILNGSDPHIRSSARKIKSRKLFFSERLKKEEGAIITDDKIVLHIKNNKFTEENFQVSRNTTCESLSIDRRDLRIPGKHNSENVAAASIAALVAGGTPQGVQSALINFRGISHRLEYIETINAVRYYNDSKATNTAAVIRALECFNDSVILILGGRNKGGNFHALAEAVRSHVTQIIALGEAKNDILSSLGAIVSIKTAATMEDAVFKAAQKAVPGDVVLLSPACASFDMYRDYAHRGTVFTEAVKKLKKKSA